MDRQSVGEVRSLKIGRELHRRVKTYAAAWGISVQEMTEQALVIATSENAPTFVNQSEEACMVGLSKSQRNLVSRYAAVLRDSQALKHARLIEELIGLAEDAIRVMKELPANAPQQYVSRCSARAGSSN